MEMSTIGSTGEFEMPKVVIPTIIAADQAELEKRLLKIEPLVQNDFIDTIQFDVMRKPFVDNFS